MSLGDSLKRRIGDPIRQQLTQGLSPEKVALTVAVGICIAVNPVIGTTTIGCFVAAWALGLNQPIIQAINWSSYALQILLIFPFIRLGEWIFRAPRENRTIEEIVPQFRTAPVHAIAMLGATILHAVVAWLVMAPLIVAGIYFGTRPVFRALARRIASSQS